MLVASIWSNFKSSYNFFANFATLREIDFIISHAKAQRTHREKKTSK